MELNLTLAARFVHLAAISLVVALPAAAQTVGLRAGVSADPKQFYFGGQVQTPPLVDRLLFRPNVEIGLGDHTAIGAFNVEFTYLFPSTQPWNIYTGAGPALNIIRNENDIHAEAGVNALVGIAHEDGLFAELKLGAFDSPRLKVGIGYAFRWR